MKRSPILAPIVLASLLVLPMTSGPRLMAADAPLVEASSAGAETLPQRGPRHRGRVERTAPRRGGRSGQRVSGAPEPGFYALLAASAALLGALYVSSRRKVALPRDLA